MSYYSNNYGVAGGTPPWNTCPGSRFNPIQHIQEAWNETRTVYGRYGVILFYSYIWFNIVDSILAIANAPGIRQRDNQNCSTILEQTEVAMHIETTLLKQLNYFALGFLFYAHWYKFDLCNVTIVMTVTMLYSHSVYQLIHNFPHHVYAQTNSSDTSSSNNIDDNNNNRFLIGENETGGGTGECAINGGYAVMAGFLVLWIMAAWTCLFFEYRLVGSGSAFGSGGGGPSSPSFMGTTPGSFSQLGTRLMGGSPNIPMTTGFMGMQEYYDNGSNTNNGGGIPSTPNNPPGNSNTELTPLQF